MRKDEFPIVDKYTQKQVSDVLNKLRTEIVDIAKGTMNDTIKSGLYMALNIIDKYRDKHKTESEE